MSKIIYVIWQVKKEKLLYTNAGFESRDYQFFRAKDDGKILDEKEFLLMLEEYYQLRNWYQQGKPKLFAGDGEKMSTKIKYKSLGENWEVAKLKVEYLTNFIFSLILYTIYNIFIGD